MTEMTERYLVQLCRELDLYQTPELNEKLYLHYKGFKKIENLDKYHQLRCVYLEGNGFTRITGLEKLVELRTLYLHENCIEKIEGLDTLVNLDTINLSQNFITRIEGLDKCVKLNTLNVSNNKISTLDALEHLKLLKTVRVLDLSNNRIEDPAVLDILAEMPSLTVLYLKGNPVVERIQPYRMTVLSRLPNLLYLDDRPVFPEERRRVTAWASGGYEAERAEHAKIRAEEREAMLEHHRAFDAMIREARRVAGMDVPDDDLLPQTVESTCDASRGGQAEVLEFGERPQGKSSKRKEERKRIQIVEDDEEEEPVVEDGESKDAAEEKTPVDSDVNALAQVVSDQLRLKGSRTIQIMEEEDEDESEPKQSGTQQETQVQPEAAAETPSYDLNSID